MICKKLASDGKVGSLRWKLIRAVDHGSYTALLLNEAIVSEGTIKTRNDHWEVIAVKNTEVAYTDSCDDTSFVLFESAFPMPKILHVGFENQRRDDGLPLWYGEFDATDKIAVEKAAAIKDSISYIMKSVYTGQPYSGLSMKFAPKANGKLEWDDTPNRNWSMINPIYSFRNGGISFEIDDGYSQLFDENYEKAASGCNYHLSPWSSGMVRQIVFPGEKVKDAVLIEKVEVLSRELAKERVPE
jgi:hypothetical protein